ncbi:hypothetical protein Ocin01_19008 [Orchesella cincta]|uniref:Uncharacterized protein n=1 Tax=Orchesella cincta TaxID=48709 RepID=A0A1D2M408_ORCCI|nr:hypothetical protein Ocin01_19008 [Orchesella cincta]
MTEEPPATEAPPPPPKPPGKQRRQSVASSKPGSHKHHKKVDHGKHGEPPKPEEAHARGAKSRRAQQTHEQRKSHEARKADGARKSGDAENSSSRLVRTGGKLPSRVAFLDQLLPNFRVSTPCQSPFLHLTPPILIMGWVPGATAGRKVSFQSSSMSRTWRKETSKLDEALSLCGLLLFLGTWPSSAISRVIPACKSSIPVVKFLEFQFLFRFESSSLLCL